MTDIVLTKDGPPTVDAAGEFATIADTGQFYFGASRNTSYDLATKGVIPVVSVGRKKLVPLRAMRAKISNMIAAANKPAA